MCVGSVNTAHWISKEELLITTKSSSTPSWKGRTENTAQSTELHAGPHGTDLGAHKGCSHLIPQPEPPSPRDPGNISEPHFSGTSWESSKQRVAEFRSTGQTQTRQSTRGGTLPSPWVTSWNRSAPAHCLTVPAASAAPTPRKAHPHPGTAASWTTSTGEAQSQGHGP